LSADTTRPEIRAVIFDLDGVLTDTAEYHFQAWKRLADEAGIPFSRARNEQLRGVSRRRSLEILLQEREIEEVAAQEMMARKNQYYQELIKQIMPADLLPGVPELLSELHEQGLRVGIATVSKNSRAVIDGLRIWHHIDALADGYSVAASKPAPDLFLHAAAQLQIPPSKCLIVEDAAAGIEAAHAAGMHSVALGPAERFAEVRPNVILPSLEGVTWEQILAHLQASAREATTWTVSDDKFDPAALKQQETVFTIGNGYLGTRGALEQRYPGDQPATLINGLFDNVPIIHTELANAPNWLTMELLIDGERVRLDQGQVLSHVRTLDLRDGVLVHSLRWRSPRGKTIELRSERWASMADAHLCALRYGVTALDFAGEVELRAEIDGTVENPGSLVPSEVGLTHWQTLDSGNPAPQVAYLHVRTRLSSVELGVAAHLAVEGVADVAYSARDSAHAPGVAARFKLAQGETAVATKLVTYYTSAEEASPMAAALSGVQAAAGQGYATLLRAHRREWAGVWHDCDMQIEGDDAAQRAIRYNLFQLLIAAPWHSDRLSIPAKALSGFGYRGHVFWDTDIFIVPFFAFTRPEIARNLLLYRYHTLAGARENARRAGYEGAMFPWESAQDGRETTPPWIPLPNGELVRVWCGEIEQHITADVAYAVWRYWQATGDDAFMRDYGAEIILDTAVFWGSRVEYNAQAERYEIRDVIGPDEYHEHVDNNAFTNYMVRWHLRKAIEVLAWLRPFDPERALALEEQLGLTSERISHWEDVVRRIYIPYDPDTGLIEQCDGFFQLEDLNWEALEPRNCPVQLALGIEETQRYQALKQADVLMLLYLLEDEFDQRCKRANWDYYEPRTDHSYGSSLGPAIHGLLGCELGYPDKAYEHFWRAAMVDLKDLRGNTKDGIHAASAGGVWLMAAMGFAGMRLGPAGPVFTPRLPKHWQRMHFRLWYHGEHLEVDLKAALSPRS